MTADLFFEKNMVQHFVHASDLDIVVSCIVWITPLFFSRVYVFICTCMRVCVCDIELYWLMVTIAVLQLSFVLSFKSSCFAKIVS